MDLETKGIDRIKQASDMSLQYYGKPLVCTYSGGKDSDVLLELFKRSGVPFEVHHSLTTVDAPPTVYHIRKKFRELELQGIKCTVDVHKQGNGRTTMWNLIPKKKIPPTRMARYCCAVLKETGCPNRFIATGVRWDESNARKVRESFEGITPNKKDAIRVSDEIMLLNDNDIKRQLTEHCRLKEKSSVNPIIDVTNAELWDYIHSEQISHNPLYDMGYTRVGCIGCPMASKGRWKEFADFPQYKAAYIRAFDRMLDVLRNDGTGRERKWKTGHDVFLWWMEDKNTEGQYDFTVDDNMNLGW